MLSDSATNGGPVAVHATPSGEDSKTYFQPKTTVCVTSSLLTEMFTWFRRCLFGRRVDGI